MMIKLMETDDEKRGKAYVHWKSWQEAYQDLLPKDFLQNTITLEQCQEWTFRYPERTLIAIENGQVVGFSCYGPSFEEDLEDAGELFAIYVLADYYGQQIGYRLMQAALEQLKDYEQICLWVLEGNARAIAFYEKIGFRLDGKFKTVQLGQDRREHRMLLKLVT